MKIIKGNQIKFIPASHEDPKNPGVLKKVLARKDDLFDGRIMMVNWAKMEVGKAFDRHYHEDMEEIFIIIKGQAQIEVDNQLGELSTGDAVIIPPTAKHFMKNTGNSDVEYIAIGISKEGKGKTINV